MALFLLKVNWIQDLCNLILKENNLIKLLDAIDILWYCYFFQIEAPVYANLVSSFEYIETANRRILNHGWVNFPLAYTQVATTAVYAYMLASLFACQFLRPSSDYLDPDMFPTLNISFSKDDPYDKHTPDVKIPYFTLIEFISYVGWIKVAETLLNPFGEDDEDFQINYLIGKSND